MSKVKRFGVSMPSELAQPFDDLIAKKGYTNRSEAFRDIIRGYLVSNQWQRAAGDVVGVVAVVYDHKTRELPNKLLDLQHHSSARVVCSTHVHLDEHNCIEVVILRGKAKDVRAIADRLIGTKGVKHGQLVATTTGRELV